MGQITIYGIKNCDTMKKAFQWFDSRDLPYVFRDYKKDGADPAVLKRAVKELGWENVLNRKGMTWRNLPDKVKEAMNDLAAIEIAIENPSVIRRPLIIYKGEIHLGFNEPDYKKAFTKCP